MRSPFLLWEVLINNTYSGKYLNEVQKLAADEGFELRYKNTADSRNLNDSITSESEERKKRWKVDAARQYSGKIAELSLTYEPWIPGTHNYGIRYFPTSGVASKGVTPRSRYICSCFFRTSP